MNLGVEYQIRRVVKVFFAGSSANLPECKEVFSLIMDETCKQGHEVLTLYDYTSMTLPNILAKNEEELKAYCRKWQQLITEADVAVVEASMPGTVNIGVLIADLVERSVPTVCIYRRGRKPALIDDLFSSKLIWVEYAALNEVEKLVRWGLEEAAGWLERRFTFIISGEIDAYLERVTKRKGINKSEFIRELIEEKMKMDA